MKSICLGTANTYRYPQGGHLWVFLNWALGFRDAGLDVVWLDVVEDDDPENVIREKLSILRTRLEPWGLGDRIALIRPDGRDALPPGLCVPADEALSADALFNTRYDLSQVVIDRFRKSLLLDLDPGLLQYAIRQGEYKLGQHGRHFSIGINLHVPFLDVGVRWQHSFPCVHVKSWPVLPVPPGAPVTTVSHWNEDWMVDEQGRTYPNQKRDAMADYFDLPSKSGLPMELALLLSGRDDDERGREFLQRHAWRVSDAHAVVGTPVTYQEYIQSSLAEFSCAKPSYVRMNTAWISDRTICYLAAGRPAIVQHTGDHPDLPGTNGLLRFRDPGDALAKLNDVVARYDHHARAAREVAETVFSTDRVVPRILDALDTSVPV